MLYLVLALVAAGLTFFLARKRPSRGKRAGKKGDQRPPKTSGPQSGDRKTGNLTQQTT